ncbi:Hypothetical predicted protein [Cloeon dipterum]|uniref:C-type lectin domain-containing protein n=1 Tax=Cloeon dipterum TaxID=197152 RepID=A0A8S1DXW2_9INSE|nr:Hypothetical predicted protein [Cloeon dipterum]
MSFQKELCLICERPTADGAILAAHVDQEKLNNWFLNVCGNELAEEIEDEDKICYFCIWQAEFLWKFNGMSDEALIWWNLDLDDAAKELRKHYFEGNIEQCWVPLEEIDLTESEEDETEKYDVELESEAQSNICSRKKICLYCGSGGLADMSFQKTLCLICERPTADGALLAAHVDQEKLQTWFFNVCGYELAEEVEDEDKICYFCIWQAEFLWKFNGMSDEDLVWWNLDLDDAAIELRKHYFEGNIEQCWVQLEEVDLPECEEVETKEKEVESESEAQSNICSEKKKCLYCGSGGLADMSFQKTLCLICESPTADGAVLAVQVDKEKLETWFLNISGLELAEEIEDEDTICYFCLWHAEFHWKFNGMSDEDLIWWNLDLDDAAKELRKHYFEGNIEQCWVQLEEVDLPECEEDEIEEEEVESESEKQSNICSEKKKCLYCAFALCAAQFGQVEMSRSKSHRNLIIKCCGRKSCLNVPPKRVNRTLATRITQTRITQSAKTFSIKRTTSSPDGNIVMESTEVPPSEDADTEAMMEITENINAVTQTESQQSLTSAAFTETNISSGKLTTSPSSSGSSKNSENTVKESTVGTVVQTNFIPTEKNLTSTTVSLGTVSADSSINALLSTSSISNKTTSENSTTGTNSISTTRSNDETLTTTSPSSVSTSTSDFQAAVSSGAPVSNDPIVIYDCSGLSCLRNNSLFDRDGVLNDAKAYGSWREICGELYLFGKSIVTWKENLKRCCSIGMKPIAFETFDQFNCLKKLTTQEVWKYSSNYWTAARQVWSNDLFQWCSLSPPERFANLTTMWANGFPDNATSKYCVHLSVPKTELTEKNCSFKFIFSCKGSPTPAPRCFTPVCPKDACSKDNALYSPGLDNVTKFLTKPTQYGLWKSMNYRVYMFSKENKTWNDARMTCCSIGMKLLSLDADFKYNVLSQLLGEDSASLSAKYWTSGTDNGCPGAFGWCASNRLVRAPIWAPGEPRIGNYCVIADVTSSSTSLKTSDCGVTLRFICETRDTSNSTSGGDAIKDECASNFNVSIAEQDNIFNSTSFNARIKCFLRCVGEFGGMVVNGRIVDEQLIKLAEALSNNDEAKLMKNLGAVDECTNIKGMDECDTIASAYQCGQEKAPDLVANAIKAVELNSTGEVSPLQPILGQCITDFDCSVDVRAPKRMQSF